MGPHAAARRRDLRPDRPRVRRAFRARLPRPGPHRRAADGLQRSGSARSRRPCARWGRRIASARTWVDLSNVDEGRRADSDWGDRRMLYQSGNQLWHSDSSFKPGPAQYSTLSACVVLAGRRRDRVRDMRTAYEALPEDCAARSKARGRVHSFGYSRKPDRTRQRHRGRRSIPPVRTPLVRANPADRAEEHLRRGRPRGARGHGRSPKAGCCSRTCSRARSRAERVFRHPGGSATS